MVGSAHPQMLQSFLRMASGSLCGQFADLQSLSLSLSLHVPVVAYNLAASYLGTPKGQFTELAM